MNRCTVHFLGPLQVAWDEGEPPRFRSQRTMSLLGYLASERRPVSRDALAGLFWPDESPSKGKANLRRELHNLGNILPACWEADRQTVEFVPTAETRADIYQLLDLEAAEQWAAAAELVQGEFLEGVYLEENLEFETWLLGERERWRQRAERVLRRAVGEAASAGENAQGLRFARQLLKLMPWHEQMHRQAMVLLARQGQRSAALRQYEQCKTVLDEELGVDVSAETHALYEQIRDAPAFARHNIPAATTSLIGRERELAFLRLWLEGANVRLITIAGAGGIGKTRLALALAQQLLERPLHPFQDGIYIVNLASLDDPANIVSTIANVMNFPFQNRTRRPPRQQLLAYLREKQMLLLLDNFEHLLAGAELVTDILQAAPGVRVVVTSRERLSLQGEQVLPLQGLVYEGRLPAQKAGQIEQEGMPAARLFLTAARRGRPEFTLSTGDERQLRRICRVVEGMPLALELAATWADTLSLRVIADEIDQSMGFLKTDTRDVPKRHRSMRAVFDTSWQRLSSQEQQVLARLSVFRGGFAREAAEAVAGATIDVLSRLVSHSLLRYEREAERYEIHELLRQYSTSNLSSAELEQIRTRHLNYFAAFAETVEPWRQCGEYEINLVRMQREIGNFRTALVWSVQKPACSSQGLRLAAGLEHFWTLGGHSNEGYEWLSRLLAVPDAVTSRKVRATALRALSTLESNATGDYGGALALLEQSLDLWEAIGDENGRAKTLFCLGRLELMHHNLQGARVYYQEALALAHKHDYQWGMCASLFGLGNIARSQQDLDAALSFYLRGLPIAQTSGDLPRVADYLAALGHLASERNQWSESRYYFQEALTLRQKMGSRFGIGSALTQLGEIARCEQEYEIAEHYYRESLDHRRDLQAGPAKTAFDFFNLGQTSLMLGRLQQAATYFEKCLLAAQELDSQSFLHHALEGFANLASASQKLERAVRLWGAAEAIRKSLGDHLDTPDRLAHEHFIDRARTQMDTQAFQLNWAKGQKMATEQAIAFAQELVRASATLKSDSP